jgi:biotin carboxylase
MNFVYLSPHFPPNYYQFCTRLHYLGVNVLGLADESYHHLRPELRESLTEYYRVEDMHNYTELLKACGYFTHRYGKINRLDSHNEYWLETEAQLRMDFNIPGLKTHDMARVKRKSIMKQVFTKAGIPVARGKVVHNPSQARRLISETGYPVVAKPDIGVGAAKTYKIHNAQELADFFEQKPAVDYIMEEFIPGIICTYDGLTDRDGNIVFSSSLQYSQGIMETVLNDALVYYYTLREIPSDLVEAGSRIVRAFDVRERFFHFEFFRTYDGGLVALEVNMRPPGGLTTDMFNYANDIDIYLEWANVIVYNRFEAAVTRPYHCAYVGRKFNRHYTHPHEEIMVTFGECCIPHHEPISGVFSAALGDYGYLVRSPDLDDIIQIAHFIQS